MNLTEQEIHDSIARAQRDVAVLLKEAKSKLTYVEKLVSEGQGVLLQSDVPITELMALLRKFEAIETCREVLRKVKSERSRKQAKARADSRCRFNRINRGKVLREENSKPG